MTANGSSYICYAMIISVQNLTQVLKPSITKITKTQQENTKQNTEINWD